MNEAKREEVTELFKNAKDTYKCLSICTSHITEADSNRFEEVSEDCDQIMERKYGFVIKLFEEDPENVESVNFERFYVTWGLPERVMHILLAAYCAGYRMVEFDADAQYYEGLEYFDW